MGTNSGKLALGLLALISVWVGVYWVYEPSKPPITMDTKEVVDPPPALMQVERTPTPLPGGGPEAGSRVLVSEKPRTIAVVPPEFVEYTVQTGDTFESISMRFYQTTEHSAAITRANGLGDAGRLLKPGRVIRVARDPRNLQGLVADAGVKPPAVPELSKPPQRETPPPVVSTVSKKYTVQSGDSLSKIAKKFYNDASQWERIYEANRKSMKGPHDLKLGAVLEIPE
jgi:nucleoid-associated protein YgaU